MELKIRIKSIADFIMILIVGQVVVFRYFNVHESVNKIIVALIAGLVVVIVCKKGRAPKICLSETSCFAFLIIFIGANGLIFGTGGSFRSNILMLLYPLIFMLFITWYVRKYQGSLYNAMLKLRYVINIYFLINIVVIMIQLQGTYFMVGYTNTENSMYQDLVSGLFGYSMTSALCYFSAFVIAYNVVISRMIKYKLKKKLFILYNISIALIMAYISTQNDNVSYFVFVPLTLVVVLFSTYRFNSVTGIQKILMIGLLCLFLIGLILAVVPGLYDTLYESVFYKFSGAIEHMYDGASVTHGSMERLALLIYGLNYADGWKMGKGLSTSGIYTPGTYGFVHFGNANIGAIVCLGGIWLYFILMLVYSSRVVKTMEFKFNKAQKIFYTIMITVYYIIVTLFSIPLTDVSVGLCVMFIMLVFGLNKYLERESGEISI